MKNVIVIELLERVLSQNVDLYDALGNGDYTYKQAGKVYDSQVGYPTIQALKQAIEKLKEENE